MDILCDLRVMFRPKETKAVISEWKQRSQGTHFFGVVRHSERADSPFAFYHGERWTRTDDYERYPSDPPLSDEGKNEARTIGLRVAEFAVDCNAPVHVIITSPYARCIETAAALLAGLRDVSPPPRLLIDASLGEIYGPSIMGPTEPKTPTRPPEKWPEGFAHAQSAGTWPTWPEDTRAGRRRFANTFLTYLKRSFISRRNFILVTHADCVGTALSMMPTMLDITVDQIQYGGCFLARRQCKSGKQKETECEDESDTAAHAISDLELPKESDGWQVQTINLTTKMKEEGSIAFTKRAATLSKHTAFSQKQIEKLLCSLSDAPFGASFEQLSESTMLFGRSSSSSSNGDVAPTYSLLEPAKKQGKRRGRMDVAKEMLASVSAEPSFARVAPAVDDLVENRTDKTTVDYRSSASARSADSISHSSGSAPTLALGKSSLAARRKHRTDERTSDSADSKIIISI